MKAIRFLLSNARGAVTLSILAGVVSGASNAGLLALIAKALESDNPSQEKTLAWSFAALCLLVPLARVVSQFLLLRLTETATLELRLRLVRQVIAAPLRPLERVGGHRLLAIFSGDIDALTQALAFVPILAINLSVIVACMGYLGWLSWQMFLATLAFMVVGFFTHQLPLKSAQGRIRAAREESDALFQHVRSLLGGTKELKLHARRRHAFLERFAVTGRTIRDLNILARLIFSAVATWGQLLFFVLIGLLLFVFSGPAGLTREVLLGFSLVLLYMRAPLQVILDRLPELSRANVAVQKIEEVGLSLKTNAFEAEADPLLADRRGWRTLTLAGASHSYSSDTADDEFVLGPLDLTFRRGELVFLIGGNGSGKTTLAKLLLGLYTPQEGAVLADGVPVSNANRDSYRQQFSAVFSDFHLFEDLLGLEAPNLDAQAREYLKRLELDHKVRVEDGALSSISLSQGQRKRLALLTALLEDRPVYVFDEWAADQDPHFKEIFYRAFLPALKAKGKTVFVISHDDRYYEVADRVVKLEYGKVVEDSAPVPSVPVRLASHSSEMPPQILASDLESDNVRKKERKFVISTLWQDIRYSVRTLLKNPGFTLATLLVLGLGISGTTAVFSIIDGALLRPLPYEDSGRLVILHENKLNAGLDNVAVSIPNFLDWQQQSRTLPAMAAFDARDFSLEVDGRTVVVSGAAVSPSLFEVLGTEMPAGRGFSAEEGRSGERVAVIGDGLRRRLFGPDAEAVGRTMRFDGETYRVVGVTPAEFTFPTRAEVWVPLKLDGAGVERSNHFLYVVARLAPGTSHEQAMAEMQTIGGRLAEQYPDTNADTGVAIKTLREHFLGEARTILWVLLATVAFVLLIACANVANLLLARAGARQREVAVRAALGGGRMRLLRQFLTESFILALLGGALGALLARWELAVILRTIPIELPLWLHITIDSRVLAFTLFCSALTAAIFGLAPALRLSRPDLNLMLKEGTVNSRQRMRGALVVAEVALSTVLLICAGLMITSLLRLQEVEPGFSPQRVVAAEIGPLPRTSYPEREQVVTLFEQVRERLAALPGVESVGMNSQVPLWSESGSEVGFAVEGDATRSEDLPYANYQVVDHGYFQTLGIPLLKGRVFSPQDRADSTPVLLVNEKMAERFWPGQDPIGKRVMIDGEEPWLQVVGVVADVRHRGLGEEVMLDLYVPYPQRPLRQMTFVLRGSAGLEVLAPAIRGAVGALDPQQPVSTIVPMQEVVAKSLWLQRFGTHLVFAFAFVALLLAAVGLYGTLSYLVSQGTRDFGIQMALGAHAGNVLGLVLRQSLKLVLIGLAIGLPLSLLLNRALAAMLYGIGGFEIPVVLGIGLLLLTVGLLASAVPARRATKVNPVVALRYE